MKTIYCGGCTSTKLLESYRCAGTTLCNEYISYFEAHEGKPDDWVLIRDIYGDLGEAGRLHYLCPKCQARAYRRGLVLKRERI